MMRFFLLSFIALTIQAQDYTLGVGVYPGDPKENFAPAMRIDSTTYRNLAFSTQRPSTNPLRARRYSIGVERRHVELELVVRFGLDELGRSYQRDRKSVVHGN